MHSVVAHQGTKALKRSKMRDQCHQHAGIQNTKIYSVISEISPNTCINGVQVHDCTRVPEDGTMAEDVK